CMDGGKERVFVLPFQGKQNADGQYIYRIRPELKAALEELDLSDFDPYYKKEVKEDNHMKEKFNKNIILYGPPGTGKTYNTVNYAVAIMEGKPVEEVQKENYQHVKSRFMSMEAGRGIQFVTFHQSYGYEEFIEGIKPIVNEEGNVSYEIVDGVFKKFCSRAENDKHKQNYVFIIDEINRGNISKIFGELITLIEESKRAGEDEIVRAILPYSKEFFSVPSNVYILGTMNTADRSIALMDTALRRRFDFVEMMPESKVLEGVEVAGLNIAKMLDTINDRITFLYDREHTIGHAFFIPLKQEPTIEKLAEIFKNKLIPLLQEYFYEDYEKIQLVLGDNDKKEQFKFIKDVKVELKNVFKGSATIEFELPEVKYEINKDAFLDIESYKQIM
ncbi:MAG: AAA family ATPase, partial [Erysipelotrichaceae bacterium]|nr:AAA family ATPase [Erysipelotrichaceae bacterium]